jgi:hypothetical protein
MLEVRITAACLYGRSVRHSRLRGPTICGTLKHDRTVQSTNIISVVEVYMIEEIQNYKVNRNVSSKKGEGKGGSLSIETFI